MSLAAVLACAAVAGAQSAPEAVNMTLLGGTNLGGASGGEGFAMKIAPQTTANSVKGHRYLYAATEANGDPVGCFSVVDVENPAAPVVKTQVKVALGGANPGQTPNGTDEQRKMIRCNSLDAAGNTLAVGQEVSQAGAAGAGVLFYDISDPAMPRLLAYFDSSGGASRGTHHVWFADRGRTLWVSGGAGNPRMPAVPGDPYAGQVFVPKRPAKDYQFAEVLDTSSPSTPREITRFYYPGVSAGDPLPAPDALPGADNGVRAHNIDVFPERPTRAYISMIDGGIVIADISDRFRIRPISIVRYRSPGFTHTTYPVFTRDLLEVSEEALGPPVCADGPKRASVWSIKDERQPVFLGAAPFLDTARFCPPTNTAGNTGRYGSHNLWEGKPYSPSWHSDRYMLDTFFRGGVRVFDIRNAAAIEDVAHFIPAYDPATNSIGSVQINDVFVDDRGFVYIVDRFGDGLSILSSPLINCTTGHCHP
ncbi:MAG: LVIVD repeat-containing protein [Candidatus Velthaea sp.]